MFPTTENKSQKFHDTANRKLNAGFNETTGEQLQQTIGWKHGSQMMADLDWEGLLPSSGERLGKAKMSTVDGFIQTIIDLEDQQ
uniref:Uncharacterized protein n=1 Tax=Romanomermis culicivorax TaxID=13658 RepID=A0A915IZ57_ROMCU